MLGGEVAALQALIFDDLSYDAFPLFDDSLHPSEVDPGRRYVDQAPMVALIVVKWVYRISLCSIVVVWNSLAALKTT